MISLNGINSTLTPYRTLLVLVSQKPVLTQPTPSPLSPPPAPPTVVNNTNSGGGSNDSVVIGASVGGAAAVACIALFIFYLLIKKGWLNKQTSISDDQRLPSAVKIGNTKSKLMSSISDCIEFPFMYSIEDLQETTQNLCPV